MPVLSVALGDSLDIVALNIDSGLLLFDVRDETDGAGEASRYCLLDNAWMCVDMWLSACK